MVACDILELAFSRDIIIVPVRVSTEENLLADSGSRHKVMEDWSLADRMFSRIVFHYGRPDVDLMATRLSRKSPFYFSWQSGDSDALGLDSLSPDIRWDRFELPYLFPPFPLIPACLRKVVEQQVDKMILVAPYWSGKSWFPLLLSLSSSIKRLPPDKKIVRDMAVNQFPPNVCMAKLAVFIVTGKDAKIPKSCRSGPKRLLKHPGGQEQSSNMLPSGEAGLIGPKAAEYHKLPRL